MATCQIDFTGQQGGICANDPVRISRTQPAALSPHMSPQGWTEFCDRIDAALLPLDKVKHISRIGFIVFFAGFIIFMIAPFTWLATDYSSDSYSSGLGFSFFAFLIGPLVLMLGMVATQCYASQKGKAAMNDVREVCDEISRQYSSLSFHVRFQYYLYRRGGYYHGSGYGNQYHSGGTTAYTSNYIEVSIANVEAGGGVAAAAATAAYPAPSAPMVTASAVLADGGRSAADRLAELEKMKGMLTDKEYDEKRRQILDSV